jgi:hypothetical protein
MGKKKKQLQMQRRTENTKKPSPPGKSKNRKGMPVTEADFGDMTEAENRAMIIDGHGKYWDYDPETDMIYPYSEERVKEHLLSEAAKQQNPDDAEREQELLKLYPPPQDRKVMLNLSDTEEDFQVRAFKAWVNGRDIPVEDLCILFNRDEVTIQRWMTRKE